MIKSCILGEDDDNLRFFISAGRRTSIDGSGIGWITEGELLNPKKRGRFPHESEKNKMFTNSQFLFMFITDTLDDFLTVEQKKARVRGEKSP